MEEKLKVAQGQIEYWQEIKADLEAEFAEAEKPELQSGDYGLWRLHKNDLFHFAIYIDHALTPDTMFYDDGMCCSQASVQNMTTLGEFKKFGNIFDDLNAIAEPLEEFEMCTCKFTLSDGCIRMEIAHGRSMAYFGNGNYPALILNLRRLQATHERQKNDTT